jgi:hypothetical protein
MYCANPAVGLALRSQSANPDVTPEGVQVVRGTWQTGNLGSLVARPWSDVQTRDDASEVDTCSQVGNPLAGVLVVVGTLQVVARSLAGHVATE